MSTYYNKDGIGPSAGTTPPVDAPEDYALGIWAGELPLRLAPGEPAADSRCRAPLPASVRSYSRTHA